MSFYISISMIEASLWGFNRDEYYHQGKNSGPGYRYWNQEHTKLEWVPQEDFEKEYSVKLESNQTITDSDAANFIVATHYWNVSANTLVVEAELINGTLLSETYSCPSSCDLDEEEAKRICMRQIYEKLKFLLAFLLQCAKPEQRFRSENEKE
ncbi:Gp49 family protein [Anaeroarcus burkinensis]|uniref:Gp49 family protein n=1 Tax=Anaeroarcus burkinensis TaxID=82376 RepID=UPI00040FC916|nr:Gp49 family protein [Anaeroarcus burkinensis]